jgi:hypothetical protein
MRSVTIALAVALALLAIAIGVVLSHSPLVVAGANAVEAPLYRDGVVLADASSCQPAGVVPEGTSAIRISMGANADPKIGVKVFAASRLITEGERPAGGGLNASATVPVRRVKRTIRNARVCIAIGPGEAVGIRGISPHPVPSNIYRLQDVALRTEYLRPGPKSWWSLTSSIAHDFGLGRGFGGTWTVFFVLALMLVVVVLASRLTLRELR